jgi:hypothetical protein
MNKGDIKATVIMLIYITAGVIGGYYVEQYRIPKDGFGSGYVLGFILGVTIFGTLHFIWNFIIIICWTI